jgi:hypothetical protein
VSVDIELRLKIQDVLAKIKDGKAGFEDLEAAVADVGETGTEATDTLSDSLDNMGQTGSDAGSEAADGVGSVDEAAVDAQGSISEMGGVARDVLQGDVAGAAEKASIALFALGPIAGIAGAAAAGGINLIKGALDDTEKKRKELEQAAADLAQAYITAGQKVLDSLAITDTVAGILTDPEKKKAAEDLAETLGVTLPQAVLLQAHSQEALNAQENISEARQARINQLLADRTKFFEGGSSDTSLVSPEKSDELTTLLAQQKAWDDLLGTVDAAKDLFDTNSDALILLAQYAGVADEEIDKVGNRLLTLPGGKQIFIDAETKQASDNLDRFQGDADTIIDHINTSQLALDLQLTLPDVPTVMKDLQEKINNSALSASFLLKPYWEAVD